MAKRELDEYLGLASDDLNLYFAGTYVRLAAPESLGLHGENDSFVYLREFVPARTGGPQAVMIDATGHGEIKPVKAIGADFSLPPPGCYNFRKSVVTSFRRTARQNKKALCGTVYDIRSVNDRLAHFANIPADFLMKNTWEWSAENVNEIFGARRHTEVALAYQQIRQFKMLARSLSPRFYITCGIETADPSIWQGNVLIGTMPEARTASITSEAFRQEAIDFFEPLGVRVNA